MPDIEITTQRAHDPLENLTDEEQREIDRDRHPMDSDDARKHLRRLEDWWAEARLVHAENRLEQAIDDDYYDHLQWEEREAEIVRRRGQAPFVFNEIKRSIDWVLGTERRARLDFHVYPRGDEDRKAAQGKTELLKYVDDVNRGRFVRSAAFEEAIRVGVGWLEDGIRSDPDREPLYSRWESWRNIWYDPLSIDPALEDCRYLHRVRRFDLDIAISYFPDREEELKQAAYKTTSGTWGGDLEQEDLFVPQLYYSTRRDRGSRAISLDSMLTGLINRRQRIRLIETWYRMPAKVKTLVVDPEHPMYDAVQGEVFDEEQPDPKHIALLAQGHATLYDGVRKRMWRAIWTEGLMLDYGPSPYRHNDFPFTPVWAHKRKRDGMAYGIIRGLRDPQDDLNKRRSKSLFILSTAQVKTVRGAVADKDEAREEVSSPDGWVEIEKPELFDKFQVHRDNTLAQQHIVLAEQDRGYIRDAAGITAENLGEQTNATSGRAILARQNEGLTSTARVFDNLRLALQIQGEKRLALIEQFYDMPKRVRILGQKGATKFLTLNDIERDPDTGEILKVDNPVAASKADFVVDTSDWSQSVRVAQFEALADIIGKIAQVDPQSALKTLDLLVDMADFPGKDEFVKRVRQINGQTDPTDEETEEGQRRLEERKQAEQQQAALQQTVMQTELAERQAKAAKAAAEAGRIGAQARKEALDTLEQALRVAQEVLAVPEAAPMVDEVMGMARQEAGGE